MLIFSERLCILSYGKSVVIRKMEKKMNYKNARLELKLKWSGFKTVKWVQNYYCCGIICIGLVLFITNKNAVSTLYLTVY